MRKPLPFWIVFQWGILAVAWAQVPPVVNYQGRITASGTNFNGEGHFKFALVGNYTNMARQAIATATVKSGAIAAVSVVDGGSDYTDVPKVTVRDPLGSGAQLTATISHGAVTTIKIADGGRSYSLMPIIQVEAPKPAWSATTFWSNDGTSVSGNEPTSAVSVPVDAGLFSVGLGDTNLANMAGLEASVFEKIDLRLRIWFSDGSGPFIQLSPDQSMGSTAYALMAARVSPASLTNLDASQLTTGQIPEARVPASIARVSNIMPEVLAHDGSGSSLNADLLDGHHASDFAFTSHAHPGMVTNTAASWVFIPGAQLGAALNFYQMDVAPNVRGSSQLYSGDTTGEKSLTLPLSLPSVLYGKPVQLDELWIDYYCENGAKNYISGTGLTRQSWDGWSAGLLNDSTPHKSNDYTNYVCTDLGILSSNASSVMLRLDFQFANKTNYIQINSVRLKLTH